MWSQGKGVTEYNKTGLYSAAALHSSSCCAVCLVSRHGCPAAATKRGHALVGLGFPPQKCHKAHSCLLLDLAFLDLDFKKF